MQISFTGTYIKPITIKKLEPNGEFIPHDVSLVEFDYKNINDVKAIEQTYKDWKIFDNCFVEIIRDVANWLHTRKTPQKTRKIFILTRQKNDYDKLNSDQILGEFMVYSPKNSKKVELEILQANPFHNYDVAEFRKYSEIGRRMIDEIKSRYKGKKIEVRSAKSATGFYEKNGFIPKTPGSLDYIYTP